MSQHPLLEMLVRASEGRFPPVDGGVTFMSPHVPGVEAVVAFTGHAVVMTALQPAEFDDLEIDGFGLAHRPEALLRLARGGRVGVLDATLVWRPHDVAPVATADVRRSTAFDDHPRVRHARAIRQNVEVFVGETGLFTLADGLAGRHEMSVEEFEPGRRSGRALIRSAQAAARGPLFAAVSPGNARSFRAFLAEGFEIIGSEVVCELPTR